MFNILKSVFNVATEVEKVDVADKVKPIAAHKIWWFWPGYLFVGLAIVVIVISIVTYLVKVSIPKKLGKPTNS